MKRIENRSRTVYHIVAEEPLLNDKGDQVVVDGVPRMKEVFRLVLGDSADLSRPGVMPQIVRKPGEKIGLPNPEGVIREAQWNALGPRNQRFLMALHQKGEIRVSEVPAG